MAWEGLRLFEIVGWAVKGCGEGRKEEKTKKRQYNARKK